MFGDILMWALTFFGLVPWDKLFGRKKDFHDQLAELSDDFHVDASPLVGSRTDSVGSGHEDHDSDDETTERVYGPWGVVPYKCRAGKRL